jgi:glycosyltransferase involved in cell wall biosynthesis
VLVPENDDQELARALLDAAQDADFLSRVGHAGADAVRKDFDLQEQAHRLEEIYSRTIGKSR